MSALGHQEAAWRHHGHEEPALTDEQPVVVQVVELALAFEPRVELQVRAGRDHTLPFVPDGDTVGLGSFQQRKGAASGLGRQTGVRLGVPMWTAVCLQLS